MCDGQNVSQFTDPHPMSTLYASSIYESVRVRVMGSPGSSVFWTNENDSSASFFFVGVLQLYSDKTATTLKANTIVAYHVHVVLLNFVEKFYLYLFDHGYTLVGLLPISTCNTMPDHEDAGNNISAANTSTVPVVPLCDKLPLTAHKEARNSKLTVLREAMQTILAPLSSASSCGFSVVIPGKPCK